MKIQVSGQAAVFSVVVALMASMLLIGCSAGGQPGAASQATAAPQPTSAPAAQAAATEAPQVAGQRATAAATPTAASQAALPTAQTAAPAATPEQVIACTPGSALTPAQTEGPYYKTNPPQRSSLLEPGMAGTTLTITGYVLTADCKPVAGARVDFWQADAQGQYDNSGYTLRGYQLTGEDGRYSVETVVPGLYPGRTRHIHVKVSAPNGPALTTQLYFSGEPRNSSDSIFDQRLVMDLQDAQGGKAATFNFILPAG